MSNNTTYEFSKKCERCGKILAQCECQFIHPQATDEYGKVIAQNTDRTEFEFNNNDDNDDE